MVKPLAFIDSRLESAHLLLQATHDYIKWQAPLDVKRMAPKQTFKVSCEAMRITVRMTQIIAWLMLQKAVLAGELTREKALAEDCQVLRGKQCLESASEMDGRASYRSTRTLKRKPRTLYSYS